MGPAPGSVAPNRWICSLKAAHLEDEHVRLVGGLTFKRHRQSGAALRARVTRALVQVGSGHGGREEGNVVVQKTHDG